MSQLEEVFMAGFWDAMGAEKTASEEVEMPVLAQALDNLGLLEEEETEVVDMPILKQAMENLGLLEDAGGEESEEGGEEPRSMLEALAVAYGDEVAAEREALEKDAGMQMIREKAKTILRSLGKATGASDIREGLKTRKKYRTMGAKSNEPKAKAFAKKRAGEGTKQALKGGARPAAALALTGGGAAAVAALRGKKKKKKGKK